MYWRLPKGSSSEYDLLTHAADAFKASNIMDYYYMEMDEHGFTPGQIERMRYALAHAPDLPHDGFFTRADDNDAFDPDYSIPVRMDE